MNYQYILITIKTKYQYVFSRLSEISIPTEKREKVLKAGQAKVIVKELRFGPQTDEHDYQFKLKHAREFINSKAKVKAYIMFKGREIMFKDQGESLLLRLTTDLEDIAKVESKPKLEGKRMNMVLIPK